MTADGGVIEGRVLRATVLDDVDVVDVVDVS